MCETCHRNRKKRRERWNWGNKLNLTHVGIDGMCSGGRETEQSVWMLQVFSAERNTRHFMSCILKIWVKKHVRWWHVVIVGAQNPIKSHFLRDICNQNLQLLAQFLSSIYQWKSPGLSFSSAVSLIAVGNRWEAHVGTWQRQNDC